ncbi:MAG: hypothetical protein KF761_06760 [Salinibacterium sp.]|nr:hypothetical protein [Salinibacterium sp.]
MSEPPPPSSPLLLPTLVTVVYGATVAALWGVLSLAFDREVIDFLDAGPLLGPAMVAAACLTVWLLVLHTPRARSPWPRALAAVILVPSSMLVVAAVGYGPVAVPHFALGPFVWVASALAGVTVLVTWAFTPRMP